MSNGGVSNFNDQVQLGVHCAHNSLEGQDHIHVKRTFEEMVMNWICLGFWKTKPQTALGTMELACEF